MPERTCLREQAVDRQSGGHRQLLPDVIEITQCNCLSAVGGFVAGPLLFRIFSGSPLAPRFNDGSAAPIHRKSLRTGKIQATANCAQRRNFCSVIPRAGGAADETAHGHAVAHVVQTLEAAGVEFTNGEQPGVRLRKKAGP